jgi:hypothetical protein
MIHKKLLAVALGITLTTAVTSVFADGLTLNSSGITSPIKVSCNGTPLPSSYELQPNSSINSIPWIAISTVFGSQTLNCTFTLDDTKQEVVGSAQLTLDVWAGKGEASHVQCDPTYSVTITPGQNVDAQSMSISIQKI